MAFKDIGSLRKKYIISFIFFFILMIILYIYKPLGLFSTFVGPTIFVTLFLGIYLLLMIFFYDFSFKHPNAPDIPKDLSNNLLFVFLFFFISAGFIILLMWLLNLFSSNFDNNTTNIFNVIFNFLLLFVMLSIIYKILSISLIKQFPLTRVILYSLFYIPCLFVNLIEIGLKEYKQTDNSFLILLMIEIVLLVLYFIYPSILSYIYTFGGKQLINQPLELYKSYDVATYQTLNDSDVFKYQYAISFWFFIDSASPSTNSNYSYYTNILSYGENPSVKYNGLTNSLIITVKSNDKSVSIVNLTHLLQDNLTDSSEDNKIKSDIKNTIKKVKNIPMIKEIDSLGQRIIYLKAGVLLQKWNNLIINYQGGTLDIFLNGELVKSAVEVVPYIKYDTLTVGANNGISGGISNLMYYKKPLTIFKIKNLYNSMKNKNPPAISGNNKTLI